MMDCKNVRDRLATGAPLGSEAESHIENCEICTELATEQLGDSLSLDAFDYPFELDAMMATTEAQLSAEKGFGAWFRSRPTHVEWGLSSLQPFLPPQWSPL